MPGGLTCEEIGATALIERYLAGKLSEPEAEAFESHFLLCDRCQTEMRLAAAIRDGLAASDEADRRQSLELVRTETAPAADTPRERPAATPTSTRNHRRRWAVASLAAAAALTGLLIVGPLSQEPEAPPVHREDSPEQVEPTALHPIGLVAAVDEFRWAPIPDSELYRVTVYDTTGAVVFEAETEDVRLRPPEEAGLSPGERYLWSVSGRVGLTRWVSSELRSFRVGQP